MRTSACLVPGIILMSMCVDVGWIVTDARRAVPHAIDVVAPSGVMRVEVADSARTRAAGLSNRDVVDRDGLLLEWSAPGRHPIWMAVMRFPLDLAWLDHDGRVLAVLTDVPPCPNQPCPLYEPPGTDRSMAVLETFVGRMARRGIQPDAHLWRSR